MSKGIFKKEYECDCGSNYGSCGAKCAVILVYYGTSDTYGFLHTDAHSGIPVTESNLPEIFTLALYTALEEVIKMGSNDGDPLTEQERIFIFQPELSAK